MLPVEGISILDLRMTPNEDLFNDFVDLYNQTFTDPREREDPAQWLGRMSKRAASPQPSTHLFVAVPTAATSSRCVVGGLVFEHYRASHCALLTYLVVEEASRRKGIARALVGQALSLLTQEERDLGGGLRVVFCEAEDPRRVSDDHSAMPTCERLRALSGLGARLIDLEYVQPHLVGGSGMCDHLRLLAFPARGCTGEADTDRSAERVSGAVVYDFLREFYLAQGVSHPDDDPNFRKMAQHLRGELVLRDPREKSVLSLKETAVCLHYVSPCSDPPKQLLPYPGCHEFQSMELDLMSYGYQIHKLLGSRCEHGEPIPVEIQFPERIDYHTEGRHMLLLPERRTCRVHARVSSTLFLLSGIRVWHVVLVPEDGEGFTEFDIIRLIHLYDGRTENTDLGARVKFRIGFKESGGGFALADGLLQLLLGDRAEIPGRLGPTAGTVQIITGRGTTRDDTDLGQVMQAVQAARTLGGEDAYKNLVLWISERTGQGLALLALCGIVTGIFDLAEIKEEEALDTIEPTFSSPGCFLRIHRCTSVSICKEDRAMEGVKNRIGISPYLLLPHAALLHNEALIEDSETTLVKVATGHRVSLRELEEADQRIRRNLDRFYLPNVFNYVTERTLFARGAEGRGTNERLAAARAKLAELDGQLESAWEQRHDRGQMRIAALLAVFTVAGLHDALFEMVKGTGLQRYLWWIQGGLALVVVLLYVLCGVKRHRR